MTHDIKTRDDIIADLTGVIDRLQAEIERLKRELEASQKDTNVLDNLFVVLDAEIERLKAHTWEQERAAIVAWLRSGTRLSPDRYALIYAASIEAGEHWPTEEEP